jgi:hypothetical protein
MTSHSAFIAIGAPCYWLAAPRMRLRVPRSVTALPVFAAPDGFPIGGRSVPISDPLCLTNQLNR